MAKEHQLAKPNEETSLALPSYIEQSDQGREQIDTDELKTPRLKVIQPLSDEAQNGDARPGDLVNSITGEKLEDGAKCVIVATRRLRNLWKDPAVGKGIVCHSPDGRKALNPNGVDLQGNPTDDCSVCIKSKFTKQGDRNVAPQCTEYREFLVLVEGQSMPLVLSMGKAAIKHARSVVQQLNAMMGTKNLPIFAFQYGLEVRDRVNNAGKKWWEVELKPAGFPPKELYEAAKGMYDQYKNSLKTTAVGEVVNIPEDSSAPSV